MKRQLLAGCLAFSLVMGTFSPSVIWAAEQAPEVTTQEGHFTVEGGIEGTDYTYENGVLTIHDGTVTVSGTSTTDRIVVGGEANVTLKNVNISFNDGNVAYTSEDDTNAGTCALSIEKGANAKLVLVGENTLKSGAGRAGLFVPDNTPGNTILTIDGDGTLDATGGFCGAGIGGDLWNNVGTINIANGVINATGGTNAGGIGGGHANDNENKYHWYGGFDAINITGGTVTATAHGNAAAIGTGCWSTMGYYGHHFNSERYCYGDNEW